MGQSAREFVDFLAKAKQSYWQLLPICPTSYGDSPYQSFSAYAGNPYFIDLDELAEDGLLDKEEYETIEWKTMPGQVDYGVLYEKRYPVLRKAVRRFLEGDSEKFLEFCETNAYWLEDYALFMTLKDANSGKSWTEWPVKLRNHEELALQEVKKQREEEVLFWKTIQFLFYRQWKALRTYANEKGISIIGDIPFYVAFDSVDVWAHSELFQLDEERRPLEVAGCPPDGFSATGQLWGNPLYQWDIHEAQNYDWWIRRIGYLCSVYNVLRIDHFRGFDSYYAIPYGDEDASRGVWREGPGMKLFTALEKKIGKQRIIAEDLGFLTDSVRKLLSDSGFPGMKVLQFAFDTREANHSEYLPDVYPEHCVAYTGTHDNDTVQGWFESANAEDVEFAKAYLKCTDQEQYHWDMMKALWASRAELTIVQTQDILGLGSESRMNTPSTMGRNWKWRMTSGQLTDELAEKLADYMKRYKRES